MIITQPLAIMLENGQSTGRWRLVEISDEIPGAEPLCDCGGRALESPDTAGHATADEAAACPVARAKVNAVMGIKSPLPAAELARIAFDAYGASTGGKTWDGKPIPPFDDVRARTPHVAAAWEAAVTAVLNAAGASR